MTATTTSTVTFLEPVGTDYPSTITRVGYTEGYEIFARAFENPDGTVIETRETMDWSVTRTTMMVLYTGEPPPMKKKNKRDVRRGWTTPIPQPTVEWGCDSSFKFP